MLSNITQFTSVWCFSTNVQVKQLVSETKPQIVLQICSVIGWRNTVLTVKVIRTILKWKVLIIISKYSKQLRQWRS